ncbi:MAG TPA: DUF4231 domain-containing protein [Pyrinomonadaceae bacterium]|nr:DUF4231 domain-containing protein [Pyrinomonadaceae bacterium]
MSAAPPHQSSPRREALDYLWNQYRLWDNTSVKLRGGLSFWRRLTLVLAVLGALAATLSTQPFVTGLAGGEQPPAGEAGWLSYTPWALGILSAVFLALTAFFTQKVLNPEQEAQWVRARAAAEAFKREAYLLAAHAPPYDAGLPLDTAKEINKSLGDLESLPPEEAKPAEPPPECPLTVDGYIASRLDEQVRWYRRRARDHRGTVNLVGGLTLGLGALAVVLGAVSSDLTAPWVAVITTVMATLAAYLYAGRFQYMVVSYLATARRLEALRADWKTSGKTDADATERNQFILECEGILGAENKAWMTELNRRDTTAPSTVVGHPAVRGSGG